jgi:hypothetical protein
VVVYKNALGVTRHPQFFTRPRAHHVHIDPTHEQVPPLTLNAIQPPAFLLVSQALIVVDPKRYFCPPAKPSKHKTPQVDGIKKVKKKDTME